MQAAPLASAGVTCATATASGRPAAPAHSLHVHCAEDGEHAGFGRRARPRSSRTRSDSHQVLPLRPAPCRARRDPEPPRCAPRPAAASGARRNLSRGVSPHRALRRGISAHPDSHLVARVRIEAVDPVACAARGVHLPGTSVYRESRGRRGSDCHVVRARAAAVALRISSTSSSSVYHIHSLKKSRTSAAV